MSNKSESHRIVNLIQYKLIGYSIQYVLALLLTFVFNTVLFAQNTKYSRANGNWNTIASWSASSGGPADTSVPVAGDTVVIEGGFDITVRVTQACDSVIIFGDTGGSNSQLIVDGGTATFNGDVTCFSDEKSGKYVKIAL